MRGELVVRADASAQMGMGHVMRCIALAQQWQAQGGAVTFATVAERPVFEARVRAEGMEVVTLSGTRGIADTPGSLGDAAELVALARERDARWVVVDGYQFGSGYQRAVKAADLNLLCVDDYVQAEHYFADLIMNQNLYATEAMYPLREGYTKVLAGQRYAMLRREFLEWRTWTRAIAPAAGKVLVTMGGGDAENVTGTVIEGLQAAAVEGLEVVVLVGGSNPHFAELERMVAASDVPMRLERDVTNVPEWMAWADVAIAGAGSTCWELAFMGLPGMVFVLADNQAPTAEYLAAQNVVMDLGRSQQGTGQAVASAMEGLAADAARRKVMSERGRILVDGFGAQRVVAAMDAWYSVESDASQKGG